MRGPRIRAVDPQEFAAKPRKKGRRRMLQPWQSAYVRRAAKLRRALSNKSLARRFGVARATITYYIRGHHKD